MLKRAIVTSMLALCSTAAFAQQTPLDKWLSPDAPECIPVAEFKKAGKIDDLTHDQFEFLRGVYVTVPPANLSLPPGDRAIKVAVGDEVMLALVTGDGPAAQSCARFNAPPPLLKMLDAVTKAAPALGLPL